MRVVSRHVFRRTARKQERSLERRRLDALGDAVLLNDTERVEWLKRTSYRVARRRGGLRWCVEMVVREGS